MMSRFLLMLFFCGMSITATTAFAVDEKPSKPPFYQRNAEAIKEDYNKRQERATKAIERSPNNVSNYGTRGNAYFFNGHYKKAVADYEKMSQLDPSLNVSHWRLGLAYHFAGRYADSAKQLELYREFDDRDRENGIWIFLAVAKDKGVKAAREKMIHYKVDDRSPLPEIYQMYEGKLTSDELFKNVQKIIEEKNLDEREIDQHLFYTHAYIGFLADAENKRELARKSFLAATEYIWPIRAGSGPEFMWHCARLKLLEYDQEAAAEKAKADKPEE